MKVVQLLLAVIVIKQCFGVEIPLDETHGLEISLLDIFSSARDIAAGLVQAKGNQLTADYFFRYTTNVVHAFPSLVTVAGIRGFLLGVTNFVTNLMYPVQGIITLFAIVSKYLGQQTEHEFLKLPPNVEFCLKTVTSLIDTGSEDGDTYINNDNCAEESSAVLREDAIQPRPKDIPDVEDIAIQVRTPCNIRSYPVKKLLRIVDDPDFDINKKVVIASSGWLTNANRSNDVLDGIGKAYHCRGDTNFLGIDVGRYIQTLYTWSSLNTNRIGEILAIALVDFVEVVPLENIHLMGHSLGAQIMGTAARHFTRLTGKQIPRVTGFDPAGPCFDYGQKQTTLSASDAAFVDIIHSNTGVAGQSEPTAHADFFVNGRFPMQNGCNDSVCSHQRSWQYYMESVYPGNEYNFLAKRCKSLLRLDQGGCVGDEYPMGIATPIGLQGLFILKVNPTEPYGMNATENYTSPNSTCGVCVPTVQSFGDHVWDRFCDSLKKISAHT